MNRRELLVAGAVLAAAGALPLRAQDAGRQRHIAVFMNTFEKDPNGQARKGSLEQALNELGWVEGRNLRVHYRWGGNEVGKYRKLADELVALKPEVIVVGGGTSSVRPLQQATGAIPIVFVTATDPVGSGLVASLARPGGNTTGLSQREFDLGTKSLELLKQLAPQVKRVAVLRDPVSPGGMGQFGALQGAASSFRVEVTPIDVRAAAEIERGIGELARVPNGGVIVTSSSSASVHRKVIINVVNRHRLPSVYPQSYFASDGGLAAYGVDVLENYRRAGAYVHRILKGEKPAEMPVQQPVKFELVINLRTARAIGLTIPQPVLLRADKIVE